MCIRDRHNTIAKGIQFVVDHELDACKDGAYLIDMQGFTMVKQLFEEINNMLELSLTELSQSSLCNCNYLMGRKLTLVF